MLNRSLNFISNFKLSDIVKINHISPKFLKSNNSAIDISDKQISLLISQKNYLSQITFKTISINFDEKILDENGILLNESSISQKIKEKLASINIKTKKLSVALPSHLVFIEEIGIKEKVESNQVIEQQILLNIKEKINYSLSDIYFDYQKINNNDKDIQKYLVVITHQKVIQAYQNLLAELNMQLIVVDVDLLAIDRFFKKNCKSIYSENKTIFLLFANHRNIRLIEFSLSNKPKIINQFKHNDISSIKNDILSFSEKNNLQRVYIYSNLNEFDLKKMIKDLNHIEVLIFNPLVFIDLKFKEKNVHIKDYFIPLSLLSHRDY